MTSRPSASLHFAILPIVQSFCFLLYPFLLIIVSHASPVQSRQALEWSWSSKWIYSNGWDMPHRLQVEIKVMITRCVRTSICGECGESERTREPAHGKMVWKKHRREYLVSFESEYDFYLIFSVLSHFHVTK